jgi:mannose-1-phosphate guanylyltransferase
MDSAPGYQNVWSIILAAGEGERLKPFVRQWLGHEKPKQYCTFVGTRSMLQHTLDRADKISEPEHKVTVVARDHRCWGWPEQLKPRPGRLFAQPFNLGTATAVFLSLAYIRQKAPNATVVLYPADHFVYPEDRFLDTVRVAVGAAQTLTQKLVLLGVAARGPELDYGWIQVGNDLGRFMGHRVRTAAQFEEKPASGRRDQMMAAGSLWNTLILAANADFLWSLGYVCFPEMMRRLERFSASIGEGDEDSNLEALYQELSCHDFSSELLEVFPHKIAVVELSGVLWSDWGRSERIMESLEAIGRLPAFLLFLAATA